MITAGAFCNRRTVTAQPMETLREISQRMRDEHVGSVVVVEQRNEGGGVTPIGLLTDRDIVTRAVADCERDAASTLVAEAMSLKSVNAREDEALDDVLKRMRSFGIRRVPVVDDADLLLGIIALDDILEFLQEQATEVGRLLARERLHETKPH
jgi:CBS domain-containing protein